MGRDKSPLLLGAKYRRLARSSQGRLPAPSCEAAKAGRGASDMLSYAGFEMRIMDILTDLDEQAGGGGRFYELDESRRRGD